MLKFRLLLSIGTLVLIFTAAVAEEGKSTVGRVAFGSCSNSLRGGEIWRLIGSHDPNLLVLLGDQFYADFKSFGDTFKRRKASPEVFELEYQRLTDDKHWKNLTKNVEWMATLDDHDYGQNNGDKNFRLRNVSHDYFWKFTNTSPLDESGRRKSGVYNAKTVKVNVPEHDTTFTYKVILLDVRSNKDTSSTVNGDFLGPEQWQWLTEQLLDPEPDLFLVGSPIQVLPDDKYVEEAWKEFPHRRQRLLKLIASVAENRNQDIVLLSGDIHSAEVSSATGKLTGDALYDIKQRSRLSDKKQKVFTNVFFHEMTSSGLSHSFSTWTIPSEGVEEEEGKPIQVTRSFWRNAGMNIYQVSSILHITDY